MVMKPLRLAMLGFGVVGQGLAELLVRKRELLASGFQLEVQVVAIGTLKHGAVVAPDGINLALALEAVHQGRPLETVPGVRPVSVLETITASGAEVLAETTWTNLQTGEPGLTHLRAALEQGLHVITANKGPLALATPELAALAARQGVQLRFEATVMSGTPVLSLIREGLAGAEITELRGILNGTTNYILTAMERGQPYAQALTEAQRLGYAEADPTADVDGWDAAAKGVILAQAALGAEIKIGDVARQGISQVSLQEVEALRGAARLKLIARVWREGTQVRAEVKPQAVPLTDPLAGVAGATNAVSLHTDTLGVVTLVGAGAGRAETGQALLSDLISIARTS